MDSGYYAAMTGLVARTQAWIRLRPIWPTRKRRGTVRSASTSAPSCSGPTLPTRSWVQP